MQSKFMTLLVSSLLFSTANAEYQNWFSTDDLIENANYNATQGDIPGALSHVNKAIEHEPENTRFLRLRGNLLFAQVDYIAAMKDFNSIVEANAKDAQAYLERAIVHFAMKNFHSALSDADKAVQLQSDNKLAKDVQELVLKTMKKH